MSGASSRPPCAFQCVQEVALDPYSPEAQLVRNFVDLVDLEVLLASVEKKVDALLAGRPAP